MNVISEVIKNCWVCILSLTLVPESFEVQCDHFDSLCCIGQPLINANLDTIKDHFTNLLSRLRRAFVGIDVDEVYPYLIDKLQCPIPEVHDLQKIFNFLSSEKHWRYDHYDLVDKLDKNFLQHNGRSIRPYITDYHEKITGYLAAEKIIKSEFFRKPNSETTTQSVTEYGHEHRRKLRTTLRLSRRRRISDKCLIYVADLWSSLAEAFELPSLTAVIDTIVEKCLEITWLILPRDADKIIAHAKEHADFFQKHSIISLAIDNRTLYEEVSLMS